MGLPVPPSKSAPAATAAPTAAPTTEAKPAGDSAPAEKAKRQVAKFGVGRGEGAIPVPTVGGVDGAKLFENVWNAVIGLVGSPEQVAALVEAYEATPKSAFPGNKEGRAAFMIGGILKNLAKIHTAGNRKRGAGKPRVKQTDKFKTLLGQLSSAVGGADKLKGMIDPELLKQLKIEL